MYFRDQEHFKELCGYEIDGVWYPRVTKIVEIKAKPALYRYYAGLANFKQGEDIKEKSASEGTLVHETLQAILIGKSPVINPEIAPAITAAVEFINRRNIQIDPEFVEKRVVNANHRYAGTIDSVALIDGQFGVLDIKTSQSIYRDYSLQTSAYMDALKDQFSGLQTRWIFRVDQARHCQRCQSISRFKGGREKIRRPYPLPARNATHSVAGGPPDWHDCPADQHQWSDTEGIVELKEFPFWEKDFQAFLGAKKLWEWENDYWLRKIGYL